jgi:hypothetical protein
MSKELMNGFRYQIIFPYNSTKIHVAENISKGADLCYQEIKDNFIKEPMFVVHSIDGNEFYHYEIPKFKNNPSGLKNNLPEPNNNIPEPNNNMPEPNNNMPEPNNNMPNLNNNPDVKNKPNEISPNIQKENKVTDIVRNKENEEIVRRLNNVEYDMMQIKNEIRNVRKHESGCNII